MTRWSCSTGEALGRLFARRTRPPYAVERGSSQQRTIVDAPRSWQRGPLRRPRGASAVHFAICSNSEHQRGVAARNPSSVPWLAELSGQPLTGRRVGILASRAPRPRRGRAAALRAFRAAGSAVKRRVKEHCATRTHRDDAPPLQVKPCALSLLNRSARRCRRAPRGRSPASLRARPGVGHEGHAGERRACGDALRRRRGRDGSAHDGSREAGPGPVSLAAPRLR